MKEYKEIFINCKPEDFDEYEDDDNKYIPDREMARNGNTYELRKFLGLEK